VLSCYYDAVGWVTYLDVRVLLLILLGPLEDPMGGLKVLGSVGSKDGVGGMPGIELVGSEVNRLLVLDCGKVANDELGERVDKELAKSEDRP
jgi:hypothetical protein